MAGRMGKSAARADSGTGAARAHREGRPIACGGELAGPLSMTPLLDRLTFLTSRLGIAATERLKLIKLR